MFKLLLNVFVNNRKSVLLVPFQSEDGEDLISPPDDLLDSEELRFRSKLSNTIKLALESSSSFVLDRLSSISTFLLSSTGVLRIVAGAAVTPLGVILVAGTIMYEFITGLVSRRSVNNFKRNIIYKLLHVYPQKVLPLNKKTVVTRSYTNGSGVTSACTLFSAAAASIDYFGGVGNDDVGPSTLKLSHTELFDDELSLLLTKTDHAAYPMACSALVRSLQMLGELRYYDSKYYEFLKHVSRVYSKQLKIPNCLFTYAEKMVSLVDDYSEAMRIVSHTELCPIKGVYRPFVIENTHALKLLRLVSRFVPYVMLPFQYAFNMYRSERGTGVIQYTSDPVLTTAVSWTSTKGERFQSRILTHELYDLQVRGEHYDSGIAEYIFFLCSKQVSSVRSYQKGVTPRQQFVDEFCDIIKGGKSLLISLRSNSQYDAVRHRIYIQGDVENFETPTAIVVDSVSTPGAFRDIYGLYHFSYYIDSNEVDFGQTLFSKCVDRLPYSVTKNGDVVLVNDRTYDARVSDRADVIAGSHVVKHQTSSEFFTLHLPESYSHRVKYVNSPITGVSNLINHVHSRLSYSIADSLLKFSFDDYSKDKNVIFGDISLMKRLTHNYSVFTNLQKLGNILYDLSAGYNLSLTIIDK